MKSSDILYVAMGRLSAIAWISLAAFLLPAQTPQPSSQAVPVPVQPPAAAPPVENVVWQGRTYRELRSLSDLPQKVRDFLRIGGGLSGMADRGADFNPTDAVQPNLPMRRFLVAGMQGDSAIIAYERSGIAHSFEVLLLRNIGTTPTIETRWPLAGPPESLRMLIGWISTNQNPAR